MPSLLLILNSGLLKKSVNRLAKYRPTQEVPGFKKSNSGRTIRLTMDPALMQSFQVLSKTSLSNAEAIYQEAKQDFLMNSSLSIAKLIQNKQKEKDKREKGGELTQKIIPRWV